MRAHNRFSIQNIFESASPQQQKKNCKNGNECMIKNRWKKGRTVIMPWNQRSQELAWNLAKK